MLISVSSTTLSSLIVRHALPSTIGDPTFQLLPLVYRTVCLITLTSSLPVFQSISKDLSLYSLSFT